MKKSESCKLVTRRRIFLRAPTKSQPKSLIRSKGYILRQASNVQICACVRRAAGCKRIKSGFYPVKSLGRFMKSAVFIRNILAAGIGLLCFLLFIIGFCYLVRFKVRYQKELGIFTPWPLVCYVYINRI